MMMRFEFGSSFGMLAIALMIWLKLERMN